MGEQGPANAEHLSFAGGEISADISGQVFQDQEIHIYHLLIFFNNRPGADDCCPPPGGFS
jgi:hypothetical protein